MKKIALYLIIIVLCLGCAKQEKNVSSTEGFFAAILVKDIENSINWYESNFNFQVKNKTENDAVGLKQANLNKDNFHVELIELNSAIDAKEEIEDYNEKTKLIGLFKLGFKVNNFDSLVRKLKHNNITFKGNIVKDPITNKKMVIVLDPDGNRIQLFEN
ncbi:VOC family protein [Winogradskyella sp.]|uniref:VOC family protein n=1 Tax=Winogradskyella sp. TaxID=1883156 RepID=UPI0025D1D306|nr:VOC family protein [Winogradskyella sp.]